jgi:hypothetical protein
MTPKLDFGNDLCCGMGIRPSSWFYELVQFGLM